MGITIGWGYEVGPGGDVGGGGGSIQIFLS